MAALQKRCGASTTAGKISSSVAKPCSRRVTVCRAQQATTVGQKLAAAAATAMMTLGAFSGMPAMASEFDVLAAETPKAYYLDDANVLSKATAGDINRKLKTLEIETGYHVNVVTVRKLEVETDAFAFGDKVLEQWYPTDNNNKGLLLVVTTAKEGAVTGGSDFLAAVGDDLIDSITGENIPIFTELERYNQCVDSSVDRLVAQIKGLPVPEAPKREDTTRVRTYKTKEETEKSKSVTATVVGSLLVIAVVVPMLQYYGYTAKD